MGESGLFDHMFIKVAARTERGLRENNEDCFEAVSLCYPAMTPPEMLTILAVLDGIGGNKDGEKASQKGSQAFRDAVCDFYPLWVKKYPSCPFPLDQALRYGISRAQKELERYTLEFPEIAEEIGTTIVAALIYGNHLGVAWLGDSRLYHYQKALGTLCLLTKDHSQVQEYIDKGLVHEEARNSHPTRNIITKSLNAVEAHEPDINITNIESGDLVLLMTDGITGVLTDEEILGVITQNEKSDLQAIADDLVSAALDAGSQDNLTVIAAQFEPEPVRSRVRTRLFKFMPAAK